MEVKIRVRCIEDVDENMFSGKIFLKDDYCYFLDKSYLHAYVDGINRYVYIILANDGRRYSFSEVNFNRYFINIKKERMLKIKKISENNEENDLH